MFVVALNSAVYVVSPVTATISGDQPLKLYVY